MAFNLISYFCGELILTPILGPLGWNDFNKLFYKSTNATNCLLSCLRKLLPVRHCIFVSSVDFHTTSTNKKLPTVQIQHTAKMFSYFLFADADFCCGMQTPEMAKHIPDTRVPGRPQNRGPFAKSFTLSLSLYLPYFHIRAIIFFTR